MIIDAENVLENDIGYNRLFDRSSGKNIVGVDFLRKNI